LGSRIPLAVLATAIVAFSCAPAAVAVPMPPITTVAGPAGLSDPVGIEALSNGHVLVVDDGDHVVRDFDGSGLTLVAGTPGQNFDGADGTAASALHDPSAVTSVPSGGFYVADTGSNRIRKFSGNTS